MAQDNEVVNVKPAGVVTINVGVPGIPGVPGQSFRFEDLTPDQIAQLKGEKGDPFRFEDLTEDQKAELRGPKGDPGTPGTADTTYHALLEGNVWCESASVDHVLMAVLGNSGKPFPRTSFKELKVLNTFRGQKVIGIEGEPHYSVKVGEQEFKLDQAGIGNITLDEPLADDDVKLTYHNYTGAKVGEFTIAGIPDATAAQPDDTYTENGVKYAKYGRKLVINVTNINQYATFKAMGKWSVPDIDSILIKANKKTSVGTRTGSFKDSNYRSMGDIPILVETPEKVSFANSDNISTPVKLGSPEYGAYTTYFNSSDIVWSDTSHKYISVGSAVDHL